VLQRVWRAFVKLDYGLQAGGRRVAFGQLGRAARVDRAAVGRREPGPAVPLVAHYVPVEYKPFLV